MELSAGTVNDLKQQIEEVTVERNNLERELRRLTTEPFFKRESGRARTSE